LPKAASNARPHEPEGLTVTSGVPGPQNFASLNPIPNLIRYVIAQINVLEPAFRDTLRTYVSCVLYLADLVHLARPGSRNADLAVFEGECQRRGLIWPRLVVEQFLFDHGDKPEFLEQYGHLDLSDLHWTLRTLPASTLLGCSYYDEFGDRVRSVAESPRWTLDRYREAYGDVWDASWRVPPVFIEGALHDPRRRASTSLRVTQGSAF
jgi:hypothetical protein